VTHEGARIPRARVFKTQSARVCSRLSVVALKKKALIKACDFLVVTFRRDLEFTLRGLWTYFRQCVFYAPLGQHVLFQSEVGMFDDIRQIISASII